MILIAAKNKNNGIGYKNKLLFRIPEDMRFFRGTTEGKTVVVGHSTLKSFKDGKPLPNRRNIVLSRDPSLKIENAEVCRSAEELFELLKNDGIVPRLNNTENNSERPLNIPENDGIVPRLDNMKNNFEQCLNIPGNGGIVPRLDNMKNNFEQCLNIPENGGIVPRLDNMKNNFEQCLNTPENGGISPPENHESESVFVIGGGAVYELLERYCEYAFITEIDGDSAADTFINFLIPPRWTLVFRSEKKEFEGITYTFCKYKNNDVKQPQA
ncbi:MAG: dihydrofolate reductase [Clostridiales bacterium]|jgi:dihydrofolate reductase|nr:dihydrofolate reductase [Clostridiales bacterium]